MRLVCPNCDAQYEVDNNAVPEAGRDVQCSNCGHTWFQLPLDIEAELEADQAILEASIEKTQRPRPRPTAAAPAAATAPISPPQARPESAQKAQAHAAPEAAPQNRPQPGAADKTTVAAPKDAAQTPRRTLDDSLLAVLREEAERETAVRRAETPRSLETQTDLGLEEPVATGSAARSLRDRLAKLGGQEPEPEETTQRPNSRRDLLPDIEEINSTLRASTENRGDASATSMAAQNEAPARRGSFRSGFALMLLLAVIVVFAYVAAPKISAHFPTLKQPLETYVVQVDKTRLWLDGIMKKATLALQDLTGKSETR